MELNFIQLKEHKTSNRIYILGSGKSILDVTNEEWEEINKHDSLGFNHWYVHSHEPTFYDLSYLANDYKFGDKENDMFYQASTKHSNSKFILNYGSLPEQLSNFSSNDYFKIYINHFDLFESNLEEIESCNVDEIGKYAKYWTLDFFKHFNHPHGQLLPNPNFIYKSRGQLFASIQLAVLLGYTDIRLVGVDLNSESKFQDYIEGSPNCSRSVGHGGENLAQRVSAVENAKEKNGVHSTAQQTKDKDYLGIDKLIHIFTNRCLRQIGVSLTVTNSDSLLTSSNIKFQPIIGDLDMDKITFCIPSKSNLRYLKTCIPSIRKNAYRKDHEIIIFVDSDEDGTVKWLKENKQKYNFTYYINPTLGKELYGIGRAYDYCIEKSTTDIFMIFHADMMLGKHADFKAYQRLEHKAVVCCTRIEPPLHPNAGEKILLDYGLWPEEFKEEEFDKYVEQEKDSTKVTEGIFAPWMMYKKEFFDIGGHDPIMHSCREDSDIFNRMLLAGFKFVQPWNSLVYHLTGRGAGSFDGDKERHNKWKEDMNKSTKEFIRKWGSNVRHTALMKPIVAPKYDIGFAIKNCKDVNLIEALEPWCSSMYVDDNRERFIELEQKNTSVNLSKKLHPYADKKTNEIMVTIDGSLFNNQDFQIIQQLGDIIKDSGSIGKFKLGNLSVDITEMNEHQNNLINNI